MLFTQHGLDNVSMVSELGLLIVKIAISSILSAFEMSVFAQSAGFFALAMLSPKGLKRVLPEIRSATI